MRLASDRRYHVPASPADVWSALSATDEYQRWWPWLRRFDATALAAGDVWRCQVRPPLPYTVAFSIILQDVSAPRTIGARIEGDIDGTARVDLTGRDDGCEIRLVSTLSPHGRTVRLMAGLARPLARLGHDWILDTGARQFAASVGETWSRDGHVRGAE